MCIIDGNVDCITNPISNAILHVLLPFFDFIYNLIIYIINFIVSLSILLSTVIVFITGFLGSMFATNPYATIAFSLILSDIILVVFLRVYNIFAGVTIFGFKLPKI